MFYEPFYQQEIIAIYSINFRDLISKNTVAKELFRKTSIVDGFTSYKCYDLKEHASSLIELIDFALQEIHSATKVVQVKSEIALYSSPLTIPIFKE